MTVTSAAFSALENPTSYKFHSVYIYNFTKYIEWPNNTISFTINIIGNNNDIFESFKLMAETKSSESRKIQVNRFNNVESATACDILFIQQGYSRELDNATKKFGKSGTLIITEKDGLIESGSGINFKLIENRLLFELNKEAIEKAGLKVSSKLIQMAMNN
jgi:hypothetical protein